MEKTTWVIITKLLDTPQVTPLDQWDVREADGIIKQKAAEFYDVRHLGHTSESPLSGFICALIGGSGSFFPLACAISILSAHTGRACTAWFASKPPASNISARSFSETVRPSN